MTKEKYLTDKNIGQKIRSWTKQLSPYSRRWKKFGWKSSALLVIDMQRYFLDERSHAYVPSAETAAKQVNRLIAAFKKKKCPVILTYFAIKPGEKDTIKAWWGNSVREKSPDSAISDKIAFQAADRVIRKRTYSAFRGTALEKFLSARKIKNLVIVGVLTNLCCETTARDAFDRDFNVFVAVDAMAAYSEAMHMGSLVNLCYGFSTPLITQKLIHGL